MQLYLLRHAQSESNARWDTNPGESFHYSDPGLTALGRQQAVAVAEHLAHCHPDSPANSFDPGNRKGFGLTHIYTSLMSRAVQTAYAVAEKLDLPLYGRTDLHEWGGVYEWDVEKDEHIGLPGRDRAFFTEHFPRLILPDDFNDAGWWNRPHEPRADVPSRARRVLRFLRTRHGNEEDRVLVVTHGGFLNFFFGQVLHITPKQSQKNLENNTWLVINNTGLSRIALGKEFTGLVYLNRLKHLPDELIT